MAKSETARWRHLVRDYCIGNGVDLGSGGDPIVQTAIQVDLPPAEYGGYGRGGDFEYPIQWAGTATDLPFKDRTLDYVYSSHLLEDFADWRPVLLEWVRVLKPGGYLIILIPDHQRFRACVAAGQSDNLNHKHEGRVGELTETINALFPGGFEPIMDCMPGEEDDYNIVFVAKRLK